MTFLEIGVSLGGSLEMWRNYFGPEATIVGLDIIRTARPVSEPAEPGVHRLPGRPDF